MIHPRKPERWSIRLSVRVPDRASGILKYPATSPALVDTPIIGQCLPGTTQMLFSGFPSPKHRCVADTEPGYFQRIAAAHHVVHDNATFMIQLSASLAPLLIMVNLPLSHWHSSPARRIGAKNTVQIDRPNRRFLAGSRPMMAILLERGVFP